MTQQSTEQPDRAAALNKAYTKATQRLREEYPDRFNELRKEESRAAGVEWNPKPSAKERAKQQLQALLAENPELADELRQQDVDESDDPTA